MGGGGGGGLDKLTRVYRRRKGRLPRDSAVTSEKSQASSFACKKASWQELVPDES